MPRPLIIPIFLSQRGCPHRCFFCNQESTTGIGTDEIRQGEILSLIKSHLETAKGRTFSRRQIAFYGGNFTGLDKSIQERLLLTCKEFIERSDIDSIRISTRPDALNEEICHFLKNHGVSTVEVGAQSMVEKVLKQSGRGHTSLDCVRAAMALRDQEMELGLHLMVGLPGDDQEGWELSAEKTISMRPDFVRIHPTLVLKDTTLAHLWQQGMYHPLGLKEAIEAVKRIYLRFLKQGIPVIRIGLQPTVELERKGTVLAGPYHPAFGQLVQSALFFDMITVLLQRKDPPGKKVTIRISPMDESNLHGQGNQNIFSLSALYPGKRWATIKDQSMQKGSLALESGGRVQTISVINLS